MLVVRLHKKIWISYFLYWIIQFKWKSNFIHKVNAIIIEMNNSLHRFVYLIYINVFIWDVEDNMSSEAILICSAHIQRFLIVTLKILMKLNNINFLSNRKSVQKTLDCTFRFVNPLVKLYICWFFCIVLPFVHLSDKRNTNVLFSSSWNGSKHAFLLYALHWSVYVDYMPCNWNNFRFHLTAINRYEATLFN